MKVYELAAMREGCDPCAGTHGMEASGLNRHAGGGAPSVCGHQWNENLRISRHAGRRDPCAGTQGMSV
eukprot:8894890-Pyramimonas_sp.AAC.1